MSTWLRLLCLPVCVMSAACGSYAAVRSAEVVPGPTVTFQASATAALGQTAGPFASDDCGSGCSTVEGEMSVTLGTVPANGPAFAIAGGINGINPYLDGYVQIRRGGPQVFGLGARLGIAIEHWYQIYGRYDRVLAPGSRLLLNPSFVRHWWSQGSSVAFVQGVGLQFEGRRTSVVPAMSLVLGGTERRSSGRPIESRVAFLVASLAIAIHLPRK